MFFEPQGIQRSQRCFPCVVIPDLFRNPCGAGYGVMDSGLRRNDEEALMAVPDMLVGGK